LTLLTSVCPNNDTTGVAKNIYFAVYNDTAVVVKIILLQKMLLQYCKRCIYLSLTILTMSVSQQLESL